jgi:hypothetical protein
LLHRFLADSDAAEARLRVEQDQVRMDWQAKRIEKGTDDLERRVNKNHITDAVAALWRGSK